MAKRRETFADRLRTLREAAGVTQYRLSQLSGVSKQTISRLELDETQPSWETVQALARGLGVEVTEFVTQPEEVLEPVPARPKGRPPKGAK